MAPRALALSGAVVLVACGSRTGLHVGATDAAAAARFDADPAARFGAACLAGTVEPIRLLERSSGYSVTWNGTDIGVIEKEPITPSILHRYDAEGHARDEITLSAEVAELVEATGGFAVRTNYPPELHRYDEALHEVAVLRDLTDIDGVLGHDHRFDVVSRRGIFVYDDALTLVSTAPWRSDSSPLDLVWTGDAIALINVSLMVAKSLVVVGEDGAVVWEQVDMPSTSTIRVTGDCPGLEVETVEGPAARLHAYTGVGVPRGPVLDLDTVFPHHDEQRIETNGTSLSGFFLTIVGRERSLYQAPINADGTVGTPHAVYRTSALPLMYITVLWAGYSYLAVFGGGDGPVYALRICP